jgi:hypothetical protein
MPAPPGALWCGMRSLLTCVALVLTIGATGAEPVTFSAMGCGPYTPADEPAAKFYLAQENAERTSEFLVHLGDVFHTSPKKLPPGAPKPAAPLPDELPSEAEYRKTADLLKAGNTIPTWVVPGDNEWNDLSDPRKAWEWWMKHYFKLEERFKPPWPTVRQPERPENFAFVRKGVVFIGINLVGGRVHDAGEWAARLPQNAAWVDHVLTRPSMNDVRAAVLLCQANPISGGKTSAKFTAFIDPFRESAATWKKPLLFLHADGHKWIDDQPWPEKNIRRVQLDKWDAKFPTVQVTVNDDGDVGSIFQFDRRLDNTKWKFKPAPGGG